MWSECGGRISKRRLFRGTIEIIVITNTSGSSAIGFPSHRDFHVLLSAADSAGLAQHMNAVGAAVGEPRPPLVRPGANCC